MYFKNLLPSVWRRGDVGMAREGDNPFYALQQEMNQVFDDFFKGFDVAPFKRLGESFGKFYPVVDVKESDKEIIVTAELPGMEEKDFELLLTDDALTIKGEKKEEKESKDKDYYRMERSYGMFNRVIAMPEGIDSGKADAKFRNGVLTITLPKSEESAKKVKKVPIKKE